MPNGWRIGWGVPLLLALAGRSLGQPPAYRVPTEAALTAYRPTLTTSSVETARPPAATRVAPTLEFVAEQPHPIPTGPVPPAAPRLPEAGCQAPASGPQVVKPFWKRCCQKLQGCFLGAPEEFQDPPLGHSVYANYKTHVENGEAARMAFYRYDFIDGTNALNARGREKLAQIADLLPRNFAPVVIEPVGLAAIDDGRRQAVLNELSHGPFPIPPQRVVTCQPAAIGLSGREAAIIYQNLMYQTQRQGIGTGTGTGTQGGAAGGAASPTLGSGGGLAGQPNQ